MKKLIAVLCCTFLIMNTTLNSIAEERAEQIESSDTAEIVQKEESIEMQIEGKKEVYRETISQLTADAAGVINYKTRKYFTESDSFKFDEDSLEQQKQSVIDFYDKLMELVKKGATECKCSEELPEENLDSLIRIHMSKERSKSWAWNKGTCKIVIKNNHFWSGSLECDINNVDEIAEYLDNAYDNELSTVIAPSCVVDDDSFVKYKIDWENQVLTEDIINSKFRYMEKIEFEVTADESYYDTVFEEVGELGETIHCTVEHIVGDGSIYIMTLKGSRGTKQLATRVTSWGFSGATGNKLYFWTNSVIEDDTMIIYHNKNTVYHEISFGGTVSENGVDGVKLEYCLDYFDPKLLTPPTPLIGTNIRHEFYGTEKDLKYGNNIYALFGIGEKEVYIKEQIEKEKEFDSQPQDPERYVTKKKGTFGGDVESYYLTFIGEIPLEVFGSNRPDWYSALGKNVKATLVGFTDTINGKDRDNYTMLRFSGSEKDVWFKLSFIEASEALAAGDYTSDKELSLNMEYDSLISFDGVTIIRNTVEYDTVGAKMIFSNDSELSFEGVTFSIGNRTVSVKAEDINYIGGGRATYEKLW